MPGIADSPNQGINTAPLAAIGSEQPATPALNDFMAAFRSGFITVDDLTRRTKQSVADTDNLKTSLTANDLTRRKTAAEGELLPGQMDEARTQQEIQAATAPARVQAANRIAEDEALRQNDYPAWVAKQTDKKLIEDYTSATGVPPPKTLRVKNPERPLSYDEWLQQAGPIIQQAQMEFKIEHPTPTPEQEDEYFQKRDAKLSSEYHKYEQRALAPIDAPQGSEEYAKELQKQVAKIREQADIHGARVKALPGILESNAKAGAESPAKARAEAQGNRKDYSALDEVQALRKVDASFNKIQTSLARAQTPYEDMSAIFGFMKVLDPGSTVREGEYATAEQARSIPSTIVNLYNKAATGTKLTPEQRAQLLSAAEGAYAGQVKTALPRIKQYVEIENQLGVTPGEIVPVSDAELLKKYSGSATPAGASAVPFAGTKRVVQNGVTFEWNGTTYVPVP